MNAMHDEVPAEHRRGSEQGALAATQQAQWDTLRAHLSAYAVHRPIRRVAAVGNAPLSPSAERAAAVDAADLVIRTNAFVLDAPGRPPTLGVACHVVLLSRSTAVTPATFTDYRRRAYLVPQAGFVQYRLTNRVGLLLHTPYWPADLGAMPLPNVVVKARLARLLDPDHEPGSLIPTTGTTALFLAHEMFPDADLVGAGYSFLDDDQQTHWSHQSGGHTKVNWQHRLDLEAELVRSWVADGSLRMLT